MAERAALREDAELAEALRRSEVDAEEEALAQAKAEGLTLARSDNQSGFRNVIVQPECKARPYAASLKREGKHIHLGCFATAEEAALHIARTPEGRATAALPPPMTAAEALAQAEAEGLTLIRSDNQSGFRNVFVDSDCKVRPYEARVWRDGKCVYLGHFATAEEAALARGSPVVSLSFGDECVFAIAPSRDAERTRTTLRSGDALVFGGPSRLVYHGVERVKSGTAPAALGMRPGRLNLTFRSVV